MRKIVPVGIGLAFVLILTTRVSAHVSIQPNEAVAGYTVSSVHVPNEKDVATTGVRIVVPEGVDVHGVMPVSGWSHTEKREGMRKTATDEDGHQEEREGRITEIIWTGGKIGAGEFMEFPLSVQYSGAVQNITWKAYQTYADGEVVPWDGSDEKHPAPMVTVAKQVSGDAMAKGALASTSSEQSVWMSVGALLVSVTALAVSLKKK